MVVEKKISAGIVCVILLMVCMMSSGCVDLTCAYVNQHVITDGWNENTALRNTGTQFVGLEKWCSSTYEINGKYPASLTVTTLKTLVLSDEEDIWSTTKDNIEQTFHNRIQLFENITGERTLHHAHKTIYIIYDGIDVEKNESVKVIGEVWNCAISGTSIICIGFAYVTNKDVSEDENTEYWQKIVGDRQGSITGYDGEEGLIDNVICH